MNECLVTPQHKNKSAIGCQTNGIYIKSKSTKIKQLGKINHWQLHPEDAVAEGSVYFFMNPISTTIVMIHFKEMF